MAAASPQTHETLVEIMEAWHDESNVDGEGQTEPNHAKWYRSFVEVCDILHGENPESKATCTASLVKAGTSLFPATLKVPTTFEVNAAAALRVYVDTFRPSKPDFIEAFGACIECKNAAALKVVWPLFVGVIGEGTANLCLKDALVERVVNKEGSGRFKFRGICEVDRRLAADAMAEATRSQANEE